MVYIVTAMAATKIYQTKPKFMYIPKEIFKIQIMANEKEKDGFICV